MCSWSNTQNVNVDKLDWELTSQENERHYSIPHEDHTLGTERGNKTYFMYVCPFACVCVCLSNMYQKCTEV